MIFILTTSQLLHGSICLDVYISIELYSTPLPIPWMRQIHALIYSKQDGPLPVEASMALKNGFTSKEKFGINQMGFRQQKGLV